MARTDKVLLMTGDYAQRLDALYSAAMAAMKDESPRTQAEVHPYVTLSEQFKELKAEATEAGIEVEMTSIARTAWRALKEKHPPRTEGADDDVEGDRLAGGVNTLTVEDDLVYASVTSPEFTSRAAFDEWADTLSEGEWQTLVVKAWELATGARYDPKSLPASRSPSTDSS